LLLAWTETLQLEAFEGRVFFFLKKKKRGGEDWYGNFNDAVMDPITEEQNLYFSGLPSCPRLVARSNFDVLHNPRAGGGF
jgi:hypothetical protein